MSVGQFIKQHSGASLTTSRPLANQMPISNRPLMRSKASVDPRVIVAKPALQNGSEGSRMLRHSIARYSVAAAARATERVNIVGGSSATALLPVRFG